MPDSPASTDRSHLLPTLIKRSFSLAGHRTSVALEPEFWDALIRLAQSRGQVLSALVAAVDAGRTPDRPLASALRVTALRAAEGDRQEPISSASS
jgi:predicted DNA-binding ribbon-helix-helix protein